MVAEFVNGETSGITDAAPVIIAADSVFVPPDGVIISSSTVGIGVMFDVTETDGLTSISSIVIGRGSETVVAIFC